MRDLNATAQTGSKKKAVAVVAALAITASGVGYVGLSSTDWAKAEDGIAVQASGTYSMSVKYNSDGGTVAFGAKGDGGSRETVANGTTKTIDVNNWGDSYAMIPIPKEGYEISQVVLRDANGTALETYTRNNSDSSHNITDTMAKNQSGTWGFAFSSQPSAGSKMTYDITFVKSSSGGNTDPTPTDPTTHPDSGAYLEGNPNLSITSQNSVAKFTMTQPGAAAKNGGFTQFVMKMTKPHEFVEFDKSTVTCTDESGNAVPGAATIDSTGALVYAFDSNYLANNMKYSNESYILTCNAKITATPAQYKQFDGGDNTAHFNLSSTPSTTTSNGGNRVGSTASSDMKVKLPTLSAEKSVWASSGSANAFDKVSYRVTLNNTNAPSQAQNLHLKIAPSSGLWALGVRPDTSSFKVNKGEVDFKLDPSCISVTDGAVNINFPSNFVVNSGDRVEVTYDVKLGDESLGKDKLKQLYDAATSTSGGLGTTITFSADNALQSTEAKTATGLLIPTIGGGATSTGGSTYTTGDTQTVTVNFNVNGNKSGTVLKQPKITMRGDASYYRNLKLDGKSYTSGTIAGDAWEKGSTHSLTYEVFAPTKYAPGVNGNRSITATLDGSNVVTAHDATYDFKIALPHMAQPTVSVSNTKPSATENVTVTSTFIQDEDAVANGARFVITDNAHDSGKDACASKFNNIKINGQPLSDTNSTVTKSADGNTLTIDYGKSMPKGSRVVVTYDDTINGSYHSNGYTNDVNAKVLAGAGSNITNEETSSTSSYTVQEPAFSIASSVDNSTPSAGGTVHAITTFTETAADAKAIGARLVISDKCDLSTAKRDESASTDKDKNGSSSDGTTAVTPVDPVKQRFANVKVNGKALDSSAYNVVDGVLTIDYSGVVKNGEKVAVEYDDVLNDGYAGNMVTNNIEAKITVAEQYNISKEFSGSKASFAVEEPSIDIVKKIVDPEVTEDNSDDDGHLIVNVGDTVTYAATFNQSNPRAIGHDFVYTESIDPKLAAFGVNFDDEVTVTTGSGDDTKDVTDQYNVAIDETKGTLTVTGKDGNTDLPNTPITATFKIHAGVNTNKAYDQLAGTEFDSKSDVSVSNLKAHASAQLTVSVADAKAVIKKDAEKEEISNGEKNTYTLTATNEFEGDKENSKLRGLKIEDDLDQATAEFGYKIDADSVKVQLDGEDITDESDVVVFKVNDSSTGFELDYNNDLTKDSKLTITYDATTDNIAAQSYDQSLGNVVIATAKNSKPSVATKTVSYHGADIIEPEQEQGGSLAETGGQVINETPQGLSGTGDNKTMIYAIGGVIAVAVIAGVIVLVIRKRNK